MSPWGSAQGELRPMPGNGSAQAQRRVALLAARNSLQVVNVAGDANHVLDHRPMSPRPASAAMNAAPAALDSRVSRELRYRGCGRRSVVSCLMPSLPKESRLLSQPTMFAALRNATFRPGGGAPGTSHTPAPAQSHGVKAPPPPGLWRSAARGRSPWRQ